MQDRYVSAPKRGGAVPRRLPLAPRGSGTAGQPAAFNTTLSGPLVLSVEGSAQKPAVGHDVMQIAPLGRIIPADPLIPRMHPPGRAGKLHTPHNPPVRLRDRDQVLQSRPVRHRITQVPRPGISLRPSGEGGSMRKC